MNIFKTLNWNYYHSKLFAYRLSLGITITGAHSPIVLVHYGAPKLTNTKSENNNTQDKCKPDNLNPSSWIVLS